VLREGDERIRRLRCDEYWRALERRPPVLVLASAWPHVRRMLDRYLWLLIALVAVVVSGAIAIRRHARTRRAVPASVGHGRGLPDAHRSGGLRGAAEQSDTGSISEFSTLAEQHVRLTAKMTGTSDRMTAKTLRDKLIERTGQSDLSFLSSYIRFFLLDTDHRLARLAEAVEQADDEVVRHECHALKGACLEFGAARMVHYCEALSIATRHDMRGEAETALRKLGQEFARLRPLLASATHRLH
jgi:HPt (histidine-containing phosphotransfer) domain-containing protein